jgi:putative transposase
LEKLERYLFGVVDDLHNQTASYLVRNFENILLPRFETHKMQQLDNLASSTKRRMQGLSHYRFQQKLINQCQKHGNKLYLVGEEYTTSACGSCGKLAKVGGAKVYSCDECGYSMDRDIHGARNILIKNCSELG